MASDPPEPIPEDARRAAVTSFFGAHRGEWRDRYREATFDAYNYQTRGEIALRLLESVSRREDSRLLELGCGAGIQAEAASRLGWPVTATDLTLPLLHQAKDSVQGPRWAAAAAEHLPFGPGSFHGVMMLGVIGYVSDPPAVLQALHRVIEPGGFLVISCATADPFLDRVSRAVSVVPDAIYLGIKRLVTGGSAKAEAPEEGGGFYLRFNRYWGLGGFRTVLARNGFRLGRVQGVNFGRLRFMGKATWSDRGDIRVSRALERASAGPGMGWLTGGARTLVGLAWKI